MVWPKEQISIWHLHYNSFLKLKNSNISSKEKECVLYDGDENDLKYIHIFSKSSGAKSYDSISNKLALIN